MVNGSKYSGTNKVLLLKKKSFSTPTRRSGRLMSQFRKIDIKKPVQATNMKLDDHLVVSMNPGELFISEEKNDMLLKDDGKDSKSCHPSVNSDDDFKKGDNKQPSKKGVADMRRKSSRATRLVGNMKRIGGKRDGPAADKQAGMENVVTIRQRTSPLCLFKLMRGANDEQKQAIIELGFESVIGFNLSGLPTKIGLIAVESFSPEMCTIRIRGNIFTITKEMIRNILGIPMGDKAIMAYDACNKREAVTSEWRKQFPKTQKRIYPNNVLDLMVEQKTGGRLFKLNFLVLFVIIMAEGISCSTVNQKFLPCITSIDEVRKLDWCGYVLECLRRSKEGWTPKEHYAGPLTFLVLLYVRLTQQNGEHARLRGPVLNRWSTAKLAAFEEEEVKFLSSGNVEVSTNVEAENDDEDNTPLAILMERKSKGTSLKRKRDTKDATTDTKPRQPSKESLMQEMNMDDGFQAAGVIAGVVKVLDGVAEKLCLNGEPVSMEVQSIK